MKLWMSEFCYLPTAL